MGEVRQYHKDAKTTYVYSSESYWDPVKKQSRSKRKVIGKVDPATGLVVPTGKPGRKKKTDTGASSTSSQTGQSDDLQTKYDACVATIKEQNQKILEMQKKIQTLSEECNRMAALLKRAQTPLKHLEEILSS